MVVDDVLRALEPRIVQRARQLAGGRVQVADELAQDGRVAAWAACSTYRADGGMEFLPYCAVKADQAMRNTLARFEAPRGRVDDLDALDQVADIAPQPEAALQAAQELRAQVQARAELLTTAARVCNERELLILRGRIVDQRPYADLAGEVGGSVSLMKKLFKRALRRVAGTAPPAAAEVITLQITRETRCAG